MRVRSGVSQGVATSVRSVVASTVKYPSSARHVVRCFVFWSFFSVETLKLRELCLPNTVFTKKLRHEVYRSVCMEFLLAITDRYMFDQAQIIFSPHLSIYPECFLCLSYFPGITLVSAPHLARSYHHLFPLQPFSEVPLSGDDEKWGFLLCDFHISVVFRFSFNLMTPIHNFFSVRCRNYFKIASDIFFQPGVRCLRPANFA